MTLQKPSKNSRIILFEVDEKTYPQRIEEVLLRIMDHYKKICYICTSKLYKDAIEDIKKVGLNLKTFYFIDSLTSYYSGKKQETSNCMFIESPANIHELKRAIKKVIEEGCEEIFFDNISALLNYHDSLDIIKLIHFFRSENLKGKQFKRLALVSITQTDYLADDYDKLNKDLSMFADEILYLKNIKN